jgi:hypothetical protein
MKRIDRTGPAGLRRGTSASAHVAAKQSGTPSQRSSRIIFWTFLRGFLGRTGCSRSATFTRVPSLHKPISGGMKPPVLETIAARLQAELSRFA